MVSQISAIEFYSGIGAFAEACRSSEIQVVAAFDQNEHANKVYQSNFGHQPISRNLETISAGELPHANVWWMSPPCTPFSRRGKQRDDEDPRAQSLLNLIDMIPDKLPEMIFMENVETFSGSKTHEKLHAMLDSNGYKTLSVALCSSMFGVPMRRPRFFIAASRTGSLREPDIKPFCEKRSLPEFLSRNNDGKLFLEAEELERYRPVLNIVDPNEANAYLICFTRGYYKCRKASGSLIQMKDGNVRFVAPEEVVDLFGFSKQFHFPSDMPLATRWRLVGNSVDVRCIRAVLSTAGLSSETATR